MESAHARRVDGGSILRQRGKGDDAKGCGRYGVSNEDPDERISREKAADSRTESRAEVDGEPIGGEGRNALARNREIGQQRGRGRSVELGRQSCQAGQAGEGYKSFGKRKGHHDDSRRKHGQGDSIASSDMVGQLAADQRREQRTQSVHSDGETSLLGRISLARQV